MAFENSIQSTVGHTAFAVFDDDAQVVVLDRKVVSVEFKGSAHRIEFRSFYEILRIFYTLAVLKDCLYLYKSANSPYKVLNGRKQLILQSRRLRAASCVFRVY